MFLPTGVPRAVYLALYYNVLALFLCSRLYPGRRKFRVCVDEENSPQGINARFVSLPQYRFACVAYMHQLRKLLELLCSTAPSRACIFFSLSLLFLYWCVHTAFLYSFPVFCSCHNFTRASAVRYRAFLMKHVKDALHKHSLNQNFHSIRISLLCNTTKT